MTLNDLADVIHNQAKERGFHDEPRRIPEVLMLASSELGEAFEAWRENPSTDTGAFHETNGKPDGWAIEIVDCIIVCFDILASQGLNVDFLMGRKMEYNMTRERLHGKNI